MLSNLFEAVRNPTDLGMHQKNKNLKEDSGSLYFLNEENAERSFCTRRKYLNSGEKDHIMMTVNNKSEFKLLLDGRLEAFETDNVISKLYKTCSSAYFEGQNELVINIRWLNGWTALKGG